MSMTILQYFIDEELKDNCFYSYMGRENIVVEFHNIEAYTSFTKIMRTHSPLTRLSTINANGQTYVIFSRECLNVIIPQNVYIDYIKGGVTVRLVESSTNNKINFIKRIREIRFSDGSELGLKEAKDYVESCLDNNDHAYTTLPVGTYIVPND